MQIYYDYDNQWRINATGTRNLSNPIIRYRQQPTVDFYFKTVAGSTVTAVDVSSAVSWEAAIDKDKSISTAPMCRTLSADIIATDAANGHIQIPLDAKTSQFLAAVNNVPTGIDVYFELKGYDVDDKQLHYAQCLFRAEMLVDAPGSPDPEVPDNYITEAQAAALLVAKEAALGNPTEDGMILSSTIAGVRTWIVAPTGTGGGSVWLYGEVDPTTEGENGYFYLNNVTGDVFYKSAGAWSAAILRIKGTDGEDGITYYPYFAYASDGSGTGFSLTPSSSLKYMAMIVSDAPITSPDIDDFSEAVWVKYIGDDGTGGTGSGSTWLHGESDPSTEGVEGDYYLNTTSGDIFCKGESTWGTAIMNINPTDGEDGADGQTFSATFPAATDYTLALTDAGTEISKLQVATNSIIIPTHAAVAFPTGTVIDVIGNPDCEINTSSITLAGGSEDGVFAEENQLKRLTKTDTNTWLITNLFGGSYSLPTASGSTLGGVKIGSGITITDGVISASGGGSADTYATKTSTGDWTVPTGVTLLKAVYIIAGGGGGGNGSNGPAGAGGGAGGVVIVENISVTPAATIACVIGAGGTGATGARQLGTSGGNSTATLAGIVHTATGGGGGGAYDGAGLNGGSGGGGSYGGEPGTGIAATLGQIDVIRGQGNTGGAGDGMGSAAGGGGYGSAGSPAVAATHGGDGGSGITINNVGYAGGGAGGGAYDAAQPGGTATHGGGAGGGGGSIASAGTAGTANTGGGGGGGGADADGGVDYDGGNGGSGIIIFKY
jgi:hypothetical protein